MPLINFSGIASGIDSNALIDATSEVLRSYRVLPHQNKISQLKETNDALSQLKSKLQTLQDLSFDFSTSQGGGVVKSASSSDETVVSASAANSAINGTYSLTVHQLATNATITLKSSADSDNDPYTSTSALINSAIVTPSDVTITIGSGSSQSSFTINVSSTTTLSDFVTTFNSSTTKATAIVVNVGTDADPDYRVVISTNSAGTDEGFLSIDIPTEISDPTGADEDKAWDDNTESAAQDAEFLIAGISTGTDYITRSSNSISDVIPGVTFNLKEGGDAQATITIGDDVSGTSAKIQEFVDAYNEVVAFIHENDFIRREENGENIRNIFGPLANSTVDDSLISSLRNGLISSIYYNTGSFETATNEIRVLADLGISTNSDPFNAETRKGGGTLDFISSSTSATEFDLTDALSNEPNSVNEILKKLGDSLGSTADGIVQQYTRFNGLVDSSITNNKTLIDDLNDRVAQAEAFILKQEETMRARFARLESLIGRMQQQQNALAGALSGLPRPQ